MGPQRRPAAEQPPWRRDFPIDWPEDHYVARRDFVKFLGLTSLAFVVGQLWIGIKSWLRRRPETLPRVRIATRDEVPIGGAQMFHYPAAGDSCLLLRLDKDTFCAYDQRCTHLACAVVPRTEQGELRQLYCPCHQGFFDARTGRPVAGPPRRPLVRIEVETDADGAVYAVGLERRTT
jgi:Rieske Fe-S protein